MNNFVLLFSQQNLCKKETEKHSLYLPSFKKVDDKIPISSPPNLTDKTDEMKTETKHRNSGCEVFRGIENCQTFN